MELTMAKKDSWIEEVKNTANGIRKRVLEHTINNNGGYLSQACSSAEIFALLYLKAMNLGKIDTPILPPDFGGVPTPENKNYSSGAYFNGEKSPEFDRFVLSPAQYGLVLYAALVEVGRMAPEGMLQFNKDGCTVEMIGAEHSPGMEFMTGSLGQGLSQASGVAMARKLKKETGKVWVFMSDGEWQSGQNWEGLQASAFHKLDNLYIIIDVNNQQCDGAISSVMQMEPFEDRLKSFGARVYNVNGHDIETIEKISKETPDGRPTVILANTNPYEGIEILKNRHPKLHYVRFKDENERLQYKQILDNWSK